MNFTMAPLLMHSEHVSRRARVALKEAYEAAPEYRDRLLEAAARILHAETELECADVRELVGLSPLGGCT